MGLGSILAGIGGGIGGFFLGGPAGAVALGSQAYQMANAAGAEKKGAKQQQDAYLQSAQAYQPYHQLGAQSANTLAGLLGMEGIALGPQGTMLPHQGAGLNPAQAQAMSSLQGGLRGMFNAPPKPTGTPRTLAELFAHEPPITKSGRPQTPSASKRPTSSYRHAEMN